MAVVTLQGVIVRKRLDQELVARGLVQSRARASDLIRRGAVMVAGQVACKSGQLVDPSVELSVDAAANAHVARSALKLKAGLSHFDFDVNNRTALDIGSSTGGFTQVLLECGARKVYAVDVGRQQLHELLRDDPRVVSLEGQDARTLVRAQVPDPVDAIVADVSFISVRDALDVPLQFAAAPCWLVALVKPQFEAGRAAVGKRGVVRDQSCQERAVHEVSSFLSKRGWQVRGSVVSPLPGKEGNQEWLIGAIHEGR